MSVRARDPDAEPPARRQEHALGERPRKPPRRRRGTGKASSLTGLGKCELQAPEIPPRPRRPAQPDPGGAGREARSGLCPIFSGADTHRGGGGFATTHPPVGPEGGERSPLRSPPRIMAPPTPPPLTETGAPGAPPGQRPKSWAILGSVPPRRPAASGSQPSGPPCLCRGFRRGRVPEERRLPGPYRLRPAARGGPAGGGAHAAGQGLLLEGRRACEDPGCTHGPARADPEDPPDPLKPVLAALPGRKQLTAFGLVPDTPASSAPRGYSRQQRPASGPPCPRQPPCWLLQAQPVGLGN